jgi:hypothetical protein
MGKILKKFSTELVKHINKKVGVDAPKKASEEAAEASTRAIAKQAERKALQGAKESAAKKAAAESAKQAERKAVNRANLGDKLRNYSQEEKAAMGNKVNKFDLQEPAVSYRPLDHKTVMKKMGVFEKGGKVDPMTEKNTKGHKQKYADDTKENESVRDAMTAPFKKAAKSVKKLFGSKEKEPEEKGYKKGGKVSFASKRGDGCITKGKTKGRII